MRKEAVVTMSDNYQINSVFKHARSLRNKLAPNCAYKLFLCPYLCLSLVTTHQHTEISQFIVVSCSSCLRKWLVCVKELLQRMKEMHENIFISTTRRLKRKERRLQMMMMGSILIFLIQYPLPLLWEVITIMKLKQML